MERTNIRTPKEPRAPVGEEPDALQSNDRWLVARVEAAWKRGGTTRAVAYRKVSSHGQRRVRREVASGCSLQRVPDIGCDRTRRTSALPPYASVRHLAI